MPCREPALALPFANTLMTTRLTGTQFKTVLEQQWQRNDKGEIFLQHGRYTTCDETHPDFYIALSRAKVRPGKDVVFGPAYLVVADVPLPLAIPYGFFPFSKKYSSGLIMPSYGEESERGFYLRDGGYYFAISDKWDLKLLGEIYTRGSWGISAASNYRKRYRYSGSFLFSYQNTKTGDKGTTSLIGGTRVKKSDIRIESYGTVDELNSFIGLLATYVDEKETADLLAEIQNVLFNVGCNLAMGESFKKEIKESVVADVLIEHVENAIDRMQAAIPELKSFVIPGGSRSASTAHVCRTVCRRAERLIIALDESSEVDRNLMAYVNRLSDYFFVLSRYLNNIEKVDEKIWKNNRNTSFCCRSSIEYNYEYSNTNSKSKNYRFTSRNSKSR